MTTKEAVCTIIAQNYLALAKTLGDSLKEFHPSVDFCILVIDELTLSNNTVDEKVKVLSPYDFMVDAKVATLAYKYDITEFSTALKPFLLEHLLGLGYERVVYLDPDILVLHPMTAIFQALNTSNIVLVPHILDPIPLDGCLPSEITLLQAGAYNLGFIGVANNQETQRFLQWWCERLEKYCYIAHADGLFVDQKWINLVPGLFKSVEILLHPGYDVAYWNLHTRSLNQRDGKYWVNDQPVVFFHFSGFNADRPNQLSKHQNRLDVTQLPTLATLLKHYADLLKANRHLEYKRIPYGYSVFTNGVPLDEIARSLLMQAQESKLDFPRPHDVDANPSFFKWLNSPAAQDKKHKVGPHITNYFFGLYKSRIDLQQAFPDIFGMQREAYLTWLKAERSKLGVHPSFLEAAFSGIASLQAYVPLQSIGVNVAGYFTAELGVGEAGRGYVAALTALGVPTALTDFAVGTSSRKQDNTLENFASDNPYPTNLICVNADQVAPFAAHVGTDYLKGKYNIGAWWWELPEFPEQWHEVFSYFDEIWVGSMFVNVALGKYSPIPVVKIPPVVQFHLSHRYSKEYFGFSNDEFIFLFVFDFFSIFERKNPLAPIKSFTQAFSPDEPVRLVLKCINAEHDLENFERLQAEIGDARVTILDRYLQKDEKNGLIDACDCYISLHRSEGFGLTLAEAMLLGKPVIATGWSGNMDFMTINNSYPVQFELVELTQDYGPYRQGQIWAEPDVSHAASLMRHVYMSPQESSQRARRAIDDIQSMHSPEAVARAVKARLEVIRPQLPMADGESALKLEELTPEVMSAVAPQPHLVSGVISEQDWANQSRFGKLGLFLKKVVERLIRFHINHQEAINSHLTAANQEVSRQSSATSQRVEALEKMINSRLTAANQEVSRQSSATSQRVDALEVTINSHLAAANQAVSSRGSTLQRVDALEAAIAELTEASAIEAQKMETLLSRFRVRPYMQIPVFSPSNEKDNSSLGYHLPSSKPHASLDYLGFEAVFRGAESLIKQRQSVYVPFFADKPNVLDVGCGRGEFLELMTEAGISAVGLDTNPGMVSYCASKGIENVVLKDCNTYLQSLEANSLGGVFSAQFIEHLPIDELYTFFVLAQEKLRPGGTFIAETVNPHSIQAMKTFYVDLTHIKPLFPEVMLFFCQSAGFSKAQIFYPNGHDFSEEEYWLQGEYAVVARK